MGKWALIGAAAVLALSTACTRKPAADRSKHPKPAVGIISSGGTRSRIYPYSVIPGGVDSIHDIQNAVLRDPVVAAHYALVQVSSLQEVQLNRPISRYVSFRIGSKVYWTSRKLTVEIGRAHV